MRRTGWSTRFGFYLVAAGSAFGLGNLWRFPYVVEQNGGGAFVLLFLILAFFVGMPLLVGELLLGKVSGASLLRTLRSLKEGPSQVLVDSNSKGLKVLKRTRGLVTGLSLLISLVVLAYYAVVSGWVLHYCVHFTASILQSEPFNAGSTYQSLFGSGFLQALLASAHLVVVYVIVARDVEEGIEKTVGLLMPVFLTLVAVLAIQSIHLSSFEESLRYFLYPDFSKLNLSSLGQALGHVLFTLSIGFGTMVTFGSYMKSDANVGVAGVRVAVVDSFLSILAGLIIFSFVMSGGLQVGGPNLLFQTIPIILLESGGQWLGLAFFGSLYLAALGASLGLLECVVSNLMDSRRIQSRVSAVSLAAGMCFLISLIPALATTSLSHLRFGGKDLLVALDSLVVHWALPLSALVLSQVLVYVLSEKVKMAEFRDEHGVVDLTVYRHWIFILKWGVVPIFAIAMGLQVLDSFI